MYIVLFPYGFCTDVVYGFFGHAAQCSLEDGRHAEFPLHQVSHQHHQVIGEALIHKEITLYVVLRTAVLLDGSINFLEEVFTDAVVLHQHLARSGLFRLSQAASLRGDFEQTLEVGYIRHKADIGDAQVGGYYRLEVDACQ